MLEKRVNNYAKIIKGRYKITIDSSSIIGMVNRTPNKKWKVAGHQTRRRPRPPSDYTIASAILYYLRKNRTPISIRSMCSMLELKNKKLYKNYKMFIRDYCLKNLHPEVEDYVKVVSRQLGLSQSMEESALKLCRNDVEASTYCKAVSSIYIALITNGKKIRKTDFYRQVMIDKTSLHNYMEKTKSENKC